MRLLALFVFAGLLSGQDFSFGIKSGIRLTGQLEGYGDSESKRYLVGPTVELGLPARFAVEFDALYNCFGYRSASSDFLGGTYFERVRADTWQFPTLVKYHLPVRRLRPYAAAGYSPMVAHGGGAYDNITVNPLTGQRAFSAGTFSRHFDTNHGLVAGAGLEFRVGHFRLAPEVRYIRWKNPLYSIEGSRGFYLLVPQNEAAVPFGGVRWH